MKKIANSAEWVAVTLICLYLGSYSWDWPGLEMVLSLPGITKSKPQRYVNGKAVEDEGFYIGLVYP